MELGTVSNYYLDAQLAIYEVKKKRYGSSETQTQEWLDLELSLYKD